MEQKQISKIVYTASGIVVLVLLVIGTLWAVRDQVPFLSALFGGAKPATEKKVVEGDIVVSQPVSSSGKIIRTSFKDNRYFYAFEGKFSDKLRDLGDHVIGEFTLDDDPTGMKFPVEIMPGKDDQYILARFTTIFAEGRERVSFIPADELIKAVTPETQVQLRLMYPASVEPTEEQKYIQDFLEALIKGEQFTPKRITLRPIAVGILE